MMMQVLISEASREVSGSYPVDGRSRSPERLKNTLSHRGHGGESSETHIEKGKNGRFLGSPFPFSGSYAISLAHRSCIAEGRGRARSWANPRPSRRGRPPGELLPSSNTQWRPRRRKSPRSAESP